MVGVGGGYGLPVLGCMRRPDKQNRKPLTKSFAARHVGACVCVCVCARARACVCASMRVCVLVCASYTTLTRAHEERHRLAVPFVHIPRHSHLQQLLYVVSFAHCLHCFICKLSHFVTHYYASSHTPTPIHSHRGREAATIAHSAGRGLSGMGKQMRRQVLMQVLGV